MNIATEVHARAGLLGNPSDGFFGKTLSTLVGNFKARVELTQSKKIRILPNPQGDPLVFESLDKLSTAYRQGYYGGVRLLQASLKGFYDACASKGFTPHGANFMVSYSTDIPHQVGLAGSSAIVIAALRCLLKWYKAEGVFTQPEFPNLALSVEKEELGIHAGLQDRVVQTYGGVMYMDFDEKLLKGRGYGEYERMKAKLPPLFLAYAGEGTESGAIHSDIRARWEKGDPEVRAAMKTFAYFAEDGRRALEAGDSLALSKLMAYAFKLRRKIYGDKELGPHNLRMVELAEKHGLTATTCGSGGAVVGVVLDNGKWMSLQDDLAKEGYRSLRLEPGPEYPWP